MSKQSKTSTSDMRDEPLEPEAQVDQPADIVSGGDAPDELSQDAAGQDDALGALLAERDELYARLQRVSADYQNFQKRSQQNLADSINFARGDLLKTFIPVLDHFDNALAARPQSEDGTALYEGVRIVRDELLKVLQHSGVERIEPEIGETFNPEVHEAMLRQPAEGVQANHISLALQPGYIYKGRTLRPAKVAVAPD